MPDLELMTWVSSQKRWIKKYRGKMFAVSAKQLHCEPTKAASRKSANDWWTAKQTELDEKLNAKNHPPQVVWDYNKASENNRVYAKYWRHFAIPVDIAKAEKAEATIEMLTEALKTDNPPYPLANLTFDPAYEEKLDERMSWVWWERRLQVLKSERQSEHVPTENTIRAHIDQYLELRKAKIQTGKNSLGTYETYRHRLNVFRKWCDPSLPVAAINEDLWERYYLHLASKVEGGEMKSGTMASVLKVAREFIRSRAERRLIELPFNLNSRSLSVSAELPMVETFTSDEVATRLKKADERLKLFILLALNCGFYTVDIGTLKQSEVDWENGRIIRQRVKTRGKSKKVPMVNYLLWKETFELLKKYRATEGDLALVNTDGLPLWRQYEKETDKGAKYVKVDAVKCRYFRLQSKALKLDAKARKPFKIFRKTAASKLDEHSEYGRYAEHFLGEVPKARIV